MASRVASRPAHICVPWVQESCVGSESRRRTESDLPAKVAAVRHHGPEECDHPQRMRKLDCPGREVGLHPVSRTLQPRLQCPLVDDPVQHEARPLQKVHLARLGKTNGTFSSPLALSRIACIALKTFDYVTLVALVEQPVKRSPCVARAARAGNAKLDRHAPDRNRSFA